MLRDMLVMFITACNDSEQIARQLQVLGILHSLYAMDLKYHSICRFTRRDGSTQIYGIVITL